MNEENLIFLTNTSERQITAKGEGKGKFNGNLALMNSDVDI